MATRFLPGPELTTSAQVLQKPDCRLQQLDIRLQEVFAIRLHTCGLSLGLLLRQRQTSTQQLLEGFQRRLVLGKKLADRVPAALPYSLCCAQALS